MAKGLGRLMAWGCLALLGGGPASAEDPASGHTVAQFLVDCTRGERGVACTFPIFILWQDSAICQDPSRHDHLCLPKASHPDMDAAEEHAGEIVLWLKQHPEMQALSDHDGIRKATKALFSCRQEK